MGCSETCSERCGGTVERLDEQLRLELGGQQLCAERTHLEIVVHRQGGAPLERSIIAVRPEARPIGGRAELDERGGVAPQRTT